MYQQLSGSAVFLSGNKKKERKQKELSWAAAWFSCSTSLYCLLGKIWGEHTLFCRGARADIYGAYFWLNSFESCSFPAPVSMGCWDEVNFKPYKRCHKLRVMANILCFSFESDPGHLLFPLTLGDDATLWATSLCRGVWKVCQIILHRKETFNKLAF